MRKKNNKMKKMEKTQKDYKGIPLVGLAPREDKLARNPRETQSIFILVCVKMLSESNQVLLQFKVHILSPHFIEDASIHTCVDFGEIHIPEFTWW